MINSWNKVFNKIMQIKNDYYNKFNTFEPYDLEVWIEQLDNQEYIDLFEPIQLTQYNNMVLVRYGQYDKIFNDEFNFNYFFDMYDGFYRECRSVVIDIKHDFLVIAPFAKFMNINECEENMYDNITKEIRQAKCIEFSNKLDGSMQCARFVPEYNKVIMSSSKALDSNNSWRLADGKSMLTNDYIKMLRDNTWATFIFEYITLADAHVVKYKKEQEGLYLVGIRDINTGKQYSYKEVIDMANAYNIPTTETYNTSLENVLNDSLIIFDVT